MAKNLRKQKMPIFTKIFPILGFIACAALFWPGLMRPDSLTQLNQAISGSFSDCHPPMFGLMLWMLGKIYSGSGITLLLNLALYWGGIAFYANSEKNKSWLYLAIAIFPPIIAYQLLVIKDISFVNSYIFMCAWLHFYSIKSTKPSKTSLSVWATVAFYGTACTYQSIIALPWLCLWLGKIYWPNNARTWISRGFAVFVGIAGAVFIFNKQFIADSSDRNQHLKLYDLAGISIQTNQPIFPKHLKANPNFDFERIKNLYNTKRVDDLTFLPDTPLPTTADVKQRQELNNFWLNAIATNTIAYLKHRFGIFYQQLTISLLKTPDEIKGEVQNKIVKFLDYLKNTWFFEFAKWLMSCIGYVILQIFLVFKGVKHFNLHQRYCNMFFQNISGLSLVLALFFVANAAEARYAYLTIATCCFSLPMIINCQKGLCNR